MVVVVSHGLYLLVILGEGFEVIFCGVNQGRSLLEYAPLGDAYRTCFPIGAWVSWMLKSLMEKN